MLLSLSFKHIYRYKLKTLKIQKKNDDPREVVVVGVLVYYVQ